MSLTPADLEFEPPSFDLDLLTSFAEREFGVRGVATPLRGERDQNLLLRTADGPFLLKVSGAAEPPEVVDLRTAVLLHLEAADTDVPVPRVLPSRSGGRQVDLVVGSGPPHSVRLLTFVEGDTFDGERDLDAAALAAVGRQQGRLCAALADFDHPAATRFMAWDQSNGLLDDDSLWRLAGDDVVTLAADLRSLLADDILPRSAATRSRVIHNDGHPGNVLRRRGTHEPCGVIDFGDVVRAPLVNDLAVSAAGFAGSGVHGQVDSVIAVAGGFDEVCPLEDAELALVYDAVLARMVLSVLLLDFQIALCESHRDHVVAERPDAFADLAAWIACDRHQVTDTLSARLRA